MKKSLLILPLLVVSLAGCDLVPSDTSTDYGELLSLEVTSGLESEYVRYTIVDLDEISITATFANGALTVEGSDLTFSPENLDTNEIGEFEITITYLTESVVWTYSVVDYEEIDNIGAPQFVVDYFANKAEKAKKQTEFMDREQDFVVGDDNPFIFFPTIYAFTDDVPVNVTAYHSVSTVKEKRSGEWVLLSGSELESVVEIDDFASTYDFTEAAIGKEYQLTVRPYGEKYATSPDYSTSFEFRVEDGYNVYEQDDLVHFNNYNSLWDSYRTDNEITPVSINGIFFQNDIVIERDKLPDGFFYKESDVSSGDADYEWIIGSLRDGVDIYQRDIASGEEFVYSGNYFNLDYSSLPYVVRVGDPKGELGSIISHSSLMRAGILEDRASVGKFTLKNLSVIGNANRSEDAAKTGGGMFLKTSSVEVNVYNTIITSCYTTIISEYCGKKVLIEKTRGYDSFSSLLYNWGVNDYKVKDSEFIGAGGPVIITDFVDQDGDGEGYEPHTVIEDSVLRAFATGFERWFQLVGATLQAVPYIHQLGSTTFPAYGRTSITIPSYKDVAEPHFSIVGIIKDGSVETLSTDPVKGRFQIDDKVGLDFEGDFMNTVENVLPGMPRFQSSDGQSAILKMVSQTAGYLVDESEAQILPYIDTNQNYFTGEYMNLYYNSGRGTGYMGIMFELLDLDAQYD
ncbi:MAG: hypothetical protein WC160_01135 [Bacilli bacterium]